MKKNKLILFDWGNIVESHMTGYTVSNAWKDLFKEFGYTNGNIKKISSYNLSAIPTIEEFEEKFNQIKKDFNLKVDFNNFVDKYNYYFNKVSYYEDVRDYEISLRNKCFIGILSNLCILDKNRLDRQVGLKNYDYAFLSFELACKKPSIEIYEKVQKQLPFNKGDILFIDDALENINVAKNYGWNAFQTTGLELEKIKKACEDFINIDS